jgi:2-desacetyl-2-hydroxyethyl bacteriochlorophyllide A dehydrogenase
VGRDGGLAERVLVSRDALVPLPVGLPVEQACLVEPVAVSIHGMNVAGIAGGERVAVVGAGSIGLTAVAAAAASRCEIGLEARHDAQRAAGERLGASGPADGEYDVVFEAAGTQSSIDRALELVRHRGLVVFLSTFWEPVTLPSLPAMMKEATLKWAFTYGEQAGGRDVDTAAALLARRPEIAETLITHRLPLEDAPDAFRIAEQRAAGAIKVVLEPT